MKPNDDSFAENALKYGVGGLNIDGCRVGDNPGYEYKNGAGGNTFSVGKEPDGKRITPVKSTQGRFPGNIIIDEEIGKIIDKQSGISKSTGGRTGNKNGAYSDIGETGFSKKYSNDNPGKGDTGGASRFFYCTKISKFEHIAGLEELESKEAKLLSLMVYLTKLVKMPENTIILDPFSGFGTTLIASIKNNISCIGIEKEEECCEIIKYRVNNEFKEN
jgi:site-specific DNA-methyltransferase (adenine-specific)